MRRPGAEKSPRQRGLQRAGQRQDALNIVDLVVLPRQQRPGLDDPSGIGIAQLHADDLGGRGNVLLVQKIGRAARAPEHITLRQHVRLRTIGREARTRVAIGGHGAARDPPRQPVERPVAADKGIVPQRAVEIAPLQVGGVPLDPQEQQARGRRAVFDLAVVAIGRIEIRRIDPQQQLSRIAIIKPAEDAFQISFAAVERSRDPPAGGGLAVDKSCNAAFPVGLARAGPVAFAIAIGQVHDPGVEPFGARYADVAHQIQRLPAARDPHVHAVISGRQDPLQDKAALASHGDRLSQYLHRGAGRDLGPAHCHGPARDRDGPPCGIVDPFFGSGKALAPAITRQRHGHRLIEPALRVIDPMHDGKVIALGQRHDDLTIGPHRRGRQERAVRQIDQPHFAALDKGRVIERRLQPDHVRTVLTVNLYIQPGHRAQSVKDDLHLRLRQRHVGLPHGVANHRIARDRRTVQRDREPVLRCQRRGTQQRQQRRRRAERSLSHCSLLNSRSTRNPGPSQRRCSKASTASRRSRASASVSPPRR